MPVQQSEQVVVPFTPFASGLDQQSEMTLMPKGFVPRVHNLWFERGVVRRRKGYSVRRFGTNRLTSTSLPLSGSLPLRDFARFWNKEGNEVEVWFDSTFARFYPYSTGAVTSIFKETSGSTDVECFDSTVDGVISWTLIPNSADVANPAIAFTNGSPYSDNLHTIYEWDGVSQIGAATAAATRAAGRLAMGTSGAVFTFAKQIIWYGDHFLIGDYDNGADRRRNGVAWGGNLEIGIAELSASVGDSAEVLLTDTKGYLQRFIRLGAHLAIYFSHSIVICDPTPTARVFDFDTRILGTGLIGPGAIVDLGGVHIFIGQDNIYLYDGGLAPRPIGDKIFDLFFENVNPSQTHRIVAQHLPLRTLVIFYYPDKNETYARRFIAYDYRNGTWTAGTKGHEITAAGIGTQTSTTQVTATGWKDLQCNNPNVKNIRCSSLSFKAGFEVPILGTSLGYVIEDTDTEATDLVVVTAATLTRGSPISGSIDSDSKPVGNPYGAFGRVSEFRVESRGAPFGLFYTTETRPHPQSWILVDESVGNNKDFVTERFSVNFVARFVAIKIIFDSSTPDTTNLDTEIRIVSIRVRPTAIRNL